MFYSNHTYVGTTDMVTVAKGVKRQCFFKADQIWRINSSAVAYTFNFYFFIFFPLFYERQHIHLARASHAEGWH